jgi:hypothetical protein
MYYHRDLSGLFQDRCNLIAAHELRWNLEKGI